MRYPSISVLKSRKWFDFGIAEIKLIPTEKLENCIKTVQGKVPVMNILYSNAVRLVNFIFS